MRTVNWIDIGKAAYKPTWALQAAVQERIIREKRAFQQQELSDEARSHDVLLFVEHPHVYTLGKSGDEAHLLTRGNELDAIDAEFVKIDRGGDITYHGPGQIVGYPILDLDRHKPDIHLYLRNLEEVIIRVCAEYGIQAGRMDGLTGVWVNGAKVCAMGVKCSRWVSMHGFALNVNAQLSYFSHIVPCGIVDKPVSSLQALLGHPVDMNEVKGHIVRHFSEVFNVNMAQIMHLPEFDKGHEYFIPNRN